MIVRRCQYSMSCHRRFSSHGPIVELRAQTRSNAKPLSKDDQRGYRQEILFTIRVIFHTKDLSEIQSVQGRLFLTICVSYLGSKASFLIRYLRITLMNESIRSILDA
jgi:hypothetical protein